MTVLGYQFPDILKDYWDSNWLEISVRVRSSLGSWQAVHPCLLAFEAHDLASWLASVAEDQAEEAVAEFMEPCLSFKLLESSRELVLLRISFELELRPPWVDKFAGEVHVDFRLSHEDVREAAKSVSGALGQFPVRGVADE